MRLLRYRQKAGLPTFFISDSMQVLRERLTPEVLEVFLRDAVVRKVSGPNLFALRGTRIVPEQARAYPDLGDTPERITGA